ncbi:cupin domain-containing protein [Spirosoma fluminis]
MKALFEKVTINERSSLLVRRFQLAYFDAPWHYHPEYELTYIVRGHGRRFVGDHLESFQDGDLVLLGPNLPHFWRNDESFYQADSDKQVESIVIQFPVTLDQQVLAAIPEAEPVRRLFERARYGLCFSPAMRQRVAAELDALPAHTALTQVVSLLTILNTLATDRDAYLLASEGYQLAPGAAETERMKRILDCILTHFRDELPLEQVASIAGMTPAAFCRYFRKRTRKTFVEYVTELRISYARNLLAQGDLSISQVGLESGFTTISHFHRHFKRQTGLTPLRYQAVVRGGT